MLAPTRTPSPSASACSMTGPAPAVCKAAGDWTVADASDLPEFPIDLVERFAALELIDHTLIPILAHRLSAGTAMGGRRPDREST